MNPYGNMVSNTPPVIKNLIIINAIMLVAKYISPVFMDSTFAIFYPESPLFRPFQLLTHMFMHGDFVHFFFNMFSLWMFGQIVENTWGGRRFLLYYLITGFGALATHMLVQWLQVSAFEKTVDPVMLDQIKQTFTRDQALGMFTQLTNNGSIYINKWEAMMISPTLGASGAIFGVLLAFGMMYPNAPLQLIFPPIVMKAKWLVLIFGAGELIMGFTRTNDGVAHFAHLGGMIFGFILIKYWQKKGTLWHKGN